MSVVITGGCGFIGSRLAIALGVAGEDVRVVDIAAAPPDLDVRVERRDITRPSELTGAFAGAHVVVHAAAELSRGCQADRARGWAVNAVGTTHVLDEAVRTPGVRRVVFLSTGGVYQASTYPISEPAAVAPQTLYAATKLTGELMLATAALAAGFSAVVLRLFTVYGPGPASGARGHFIAGWMERVRAGLPLVVHGTGEQTVDATHVSDVVQAIRRAMAVPATAGACAIYNIGSGRETAVLDIARYLREIDARIALDHAAMPSATPQRQFADIRRARADLGYEPAIEPRLGVQALLREAR